MKNYKKYKELEFQILLLREHIKENERIETELRRRIKAKATVWEVLKRTNDGNYIVQQIRDIQQGPDGMRIII